MATKSNIELIFDKGVNKCACNFVPKMDIETSDLSKILPEDLQRTDLDIPNIPEFTILRHFVNLSEKNYGLDNGIYPLGSCTMKYNPKINEITSSLPGFANIHPLQEINQGALQIIYELEVQLSTICGMDGFSVNPSAGAQGELAGIMVMKKYFESKGLKKTKIIVPDSAHGTNPASAAMCGYAIIELNSDENGELPLDQLEFAMKGGDVAGLMLTNPNTVGLFDRNIQKITEIVHKYDGLCYYDGANLNPMLGICRPGDMGFDIMHVNLHKTFATPHGGGGPGAGPVGVKDELIQFLPKPRVIKSDDTYSLACDNEACFGRLHAFYGNFGVLIRAYSYILALGADGLRNAGQMAVLNANYVRCRLKEKYHVKFDRICMHEFVVEADLPNHTHAEDVAKRLLDHGVYAPTIYFPLIVHEAMMIEPTETESKETLDEYIDLFLKIYEEAENNPEILKKAPTKTPVGRLDNTLAARNPILHD